MSEDKEEKPSKRPPETDPRFPSGRWTGFWLQKEIRGRQYMRLHLEFSQGVLIGEGSDCVGDFEIRGDYELKTGKCAFIKRYIAQHSVNYAGQNQGDGKWVWGVWTIGRAFTGGFHIWPYGEADPTGEKLKEEADLPAEASTSPKVLLPSIGE